MSERSALPRLKPMLATAGELPRRQEDYAFEVKWDGVRVLAYIEGGSMRLESRNGNDVTSRYPELAGLASELSEAGPMILDGEVVAFDEEGKPSFERLQARIHLTQSGEVAARAASAPVCVLLFDVLHVGGRDVCELRWSDRRRLLDALAVAGDRWRLSPAHTGSDAGSALREATIATGLEGLVAKRVDSLYLPGKRTRDWIKVKNMARQEVVIGGWVPGEGTRSGRIGALIVGVYDGGRLRHAGKVGTGFSAKELDRLALLLAQHRRDTSPFAEPVPWRDARFVEPVLVAEVAFTEWTEAGVLRHPSYKGLRDDKSPTDVQREN